MAHISVVVFVAVVVVATSIMRKKPKTRTTRQIADWFEAASGREKHKEREGGRERDSEKRSKSENSKAEEITVCKSTGKLIIITTTEQRDTL